MSFDPSIIYCLATGKPIAFISDDEFGFILDSLTHIPLGEQATHLERLALSSMRPSLVWMNVTPDSLDRIRQSAPRQLLAYLMNRMYAPIELPKLGRPVDFESSLAARRLRVSMWESIDSADINAEQLDQILYVLLAIDSRFGLTKISKPGVLTALWESWSIDNATKLIHELWEWHNGLVRIQEKSERMARASAEFWSEGNRLTRVAYAQQFKKVTPPAASTVAKREKIAKLADSVDFLDQLERELSSRSSGTEGTAASVVQPKQTVRIMKFGVKKQEA